MRFIIGALVLIILMSSHVFIENIEKFGGRYEHFVSILEALGIWITIALTVYLAFKKPYRLRMYVDAVESATEIPENAVGRYAGGIRVVLTNTGLVSIHIAWLAWKILPTFPYIFKKVHMVHQYFEPQDDEQNDSNKSKKFFKEFLKRPLVLEPGYTKVIYIDSTLLSHHYMLKEKFLSRKYKAMPDWLLQFVESKPKLQLWLKTRIKLCYRHPDGSLCVAKFSSNYIKYFSKSMIKPNGFIDLQ